MVNLKHMNSFVSIAINNFSAMEQIIIKEQPEFLSYYKFNNGIVALTKTECDQIDLCIQDFKHFENVPEEFKIECCIMKFDPAEKHFCCPDSSIKERISINKLGILFKHKKSNL